MKILGAMSGTSLDGLDLCLTDIWTENGTTRFHILKAETIPYPASWVAALQGAKDCTAPQLTQLDREFGTYLGQQCKAFLGDDSCDYIASHGHTVFHQPASGFTLQIGHGANLSQAAETNAIVDFRSADVAVGGQGAPLVPGVEALLFPEFQSFLNLGGFANIGIHQSGQVSGFDICPVNYCLNKVALKLGQPYDDGGTVARNANADPAALAALNALAFYGQSAPKSLGGEWVEENVWHLVKDLPLTVCLATLTQHAAYQIASVLNKYQNSATMITGGGAYNTYLIELIEQQVQSTLHLPSKQIIEFKEALLFAMLGKLYVDGLPNSLPSVTGANKPTIGGCLYKYWQPLV